MRHVLNASFDAVLVLRPGTGEVDRIRSLFFPLRIA